LAIEIDRGRGEGYRVWRAEERWRRQKNKSYSTVLRRSTSPSAWTAQRGLFLKASIEKRHGAGPQREPSRMSHIRPARRLTFRIQQARRLSRSRNGSQRSRNSSTGEGPACDSTSSILHLPSAIWHACQLRTVGKCRCDWLGMAAGAAGRRLSPQRISEHMGRNLGRLARPRPG
jgi:hypothetical protein